MDWIIRGAEQEDGTNRQERSELWAAQTYSALLKRSGLEHAWEKVDLRLTYSAAEFIVIELDPWYVMINRETGRVELSKYINDNLFETWTIKEAEPEWSELQIAATLTGITISLNGRSFTHQSSQPQRMTSVQLLIEPGTRFSFPELQVQEIPEPAITALPGSETAKGLEFTVDFFDDMQLAAFDEPMLDEMFAVMARYGANRARWIHHGDITNEIWALSAASDKIRRSADNLGDDFLPPAVRSSHKAGLPLIGIFKPFDTTMCHYTDPPKDAGEKPTAVGGHLERLLNFPADHPELCQKRRTVPKPGQKPCRIEINSRKTIAPEAASGIELYLSWDNAAYRKYEGPLNVAVDSDTIVISGFDFEEEFIILQFAPEISAQVRNTLPKLAKVLDANDAPLEFTYGITPRVTRKAEYHLEQKTNVLDFREQGIHFDCAGPYMPSANCNTNHVSAKLFSPGEMENLLGISLQCNVGAPGVLSEAEPQAHAWWLAMIDEMLDAGVDGVEIRLMNHSNVIDWSLYGFNEPLVAEYQRRYGIDITREDYDAAKLRALRGEFFTDFLRTASVRVRERGRTFHLHLEDMRQGPADEPWPMGIAFPWQGWIGEGLCDEVTLKTVNLAGSDTAFGRDVIAMCHERGIPVNFAPFVHVGFITPAGPEILQTALAGPIDSFNVYEFATVFAFNSTGEVSSVNEQMTDWLQSYEWKKR